MPASAQRSRGPTTIPALARAPNRLPPHNGIILCQAFVLQRRREVRGAGVLLALVCATVLLGSCMRTQPTRDCHQYSYSVECRERGYYYLFRSYRGCHHLYQRGRSLWLHDARYRLVIVVPADRCTVEVVTLADIPE
jgi:hypothetical protein